jgi:uncharacterized protein (UPF0332 family)
MTVPSEYFQLARLLSDRNGPYPNGGQRSAISRAYYSAYLEARDRLVESAGLKIPKKAAHETVWQALVYAEEPLKTTGRLLRDLKGLREAADYNTDDNSILSATTEALQIAEKIRSTLATADLSKCTDPKFGPSRTG